MSTITVDLPETLRAYVEERVASSGYRDAGQYVLDLIRADQHTHRELAPYTSGPHIEKLLLEGLASGVLGPMTDADWERLKEPFRQQASGDRARKC